VRIYDIILKKRNGDNLSSEEIDRLVDGYVAGEVPDSQMAAFLMAVCIQGMDAAETSDLTMAMVRSGRRLDLSCVAGTKVDKHSTGGVGDKTTLVLVPVLAAAGVPMVKMSGRCLGHTGGTADKLESIPGFSTALTPEQMVDQVKRIGAVMAGQIPDLAPADKKIYALRDLTATVDCVPLIAASVMSKKIASGADAIVLDVKVGSGAFVRTVKQAGELAQAMVNIGRQVERRTVAAITDMDQPLGRAVGNAVEVREAVDTLKGKGPDDLVELCAVLGGLALQVGGRVSSRTEGERLVREIISNGRGLAKFREIIRAQGGDPEVVDDPSLLPDAPIIQMVTFPRPGYVARLDALKIAQAATRLGAGRGEAGTEPDLGVGIYLRKKLGDYIESGDTLAEIHTRDLESADEVTALVLDAYVIDPSSPVPRPLVHEIIE
jgi:pyrimidine-nucleoside phosphorylase